MNTKLILEPFKQASSQHDIITVIHYYTENKTTKKELKALQIGIYECAQEDKEKKCPV